MHLQAGYKHTHINVKGNSPLHTASRRGLTSIALFLIDQEIEVDRENKLGETPLLLAAKTLASDLVKSLIAKEPIRFIVIMWEIHL